MATANECACIVNLPPTFTYHVVQGNAPSQYIIFWSISAVALFVTALAIIPTAIQIHLQGIRTRDECDEIVVPTAYRVVTIIALYPFIAAFGNFVTLLVPVSASVWDFIVSLYSTILLYLFCDILIMYFGSHKSAVQAWREHAAPTKFYGAAPLCCVRPCISEKNMTSKDFRRLSGFIVQFIIIGPLINFFAMFSFATVASSQIGPIIEAVSTMFCIYGIQAVLTASKELLSDHSVADKFRPIQLGFAIGTVPDAIIAMISVPAVNDVYTTEVMKVAYASVVRSVLFMLLSFAMRRSFNAETGKQAYSKMSEVKRAQVDLTVYAPPTLEEEENNGRALNVVSANTANGLDEHANVN
mmetsp:Transcript_51462/g.82033  ORF Transcript_51462/g.82033 Transcript_51462/m.82033 type:complete len:356 (+) Transcript_51462:30-1097(+)